MRAWTLVFCLVVLQLAELGCGKRFDPAMGDPLIRRSSLDKNFMRFGRSSPSFTDKDEVEETHESSPEADTDKEDSFLRSMRGKNNNLMRFGRARNDNYMRFGRGKQDSFMRFGRARNDNYMRFGRGKQDNFMRFGRGKEDNYMRFGRSKGDNYMRFGRGKQDNFMRFGRGKQDSFMRFGRVNYGKQDSFMRLGRGNLMRLGRDNEFPDNPFVDMFGETITNDALLRNRRGGLDNRMRFGKRLKEILTNEIPFSMRSVDLENGFNGVVKGKQDNLLSLGKSEPQKSSSNNEDDPDYDNVPISSLHSAYSVDDEAFPRESKSKDLNLIRLGRHPKTNNAYMRFGRSCENQFEKSSQETDFIPQRLKRSLSRSDEDPEYRIYNSKDGEHITVPLNSLPEDIQEEYVAPNHNEDFKSRRKRSLAFEASTPPPPEDSSVVDYISAKLRLSSASEPEYGSSLLSAGLPNVIVGPEFSLLPDLDPPAYLLKKGRPGDQNFLRLG